MYTYKTEILMVGTKLWSDKANTQDAAELDELLNKRESEGWELATYDYMATSSQIRGASLSHSVKWSNENIGSRADGL